MATPFMFGNNRMAIDSGFNPWDIIGPDNPVLKPDEPPVKTITKVDNFRDAAGNLVLRTTYSDGSTEDTIIDPAPITPPPTQQTTTTTTEDDILKKMAAEKRQSAFEVMRERFTIMGLGTLALEIEKIFKGEGKTRGNSPIPIPTSDAGFYLALIETDAYYKRFGAVNEARIKAGYSALDERTILGMEDEYQKVMKSYTMPTGFYDSPEDYQTFIANNLSERELADRLQASRQFAAVVDPNIKTQLKSLYNIDENMLAAYIADPAKGQDLLKGLAGKSLTAAAAVLSGITAQGAELATGFGAGEMSFAEQQQRFGTAATAAERGRFLSEIERQQQDVYGEQQAIAETFGGLESSRRARERLTAREVARFGGAAGTTTASFTKPTAGQI